MAVKNNIVKKPEKQSAVTEYVSNGETVRISPDMIKKYLVNGPGPVTDQEVLMFLSLCRFQHLNPFLREAYLIKYGERQPASMVVGKDVFLKRAKKEPGFSGLQCGIIIQDIETGITEEREGTFYLKDEEKLVGGWAKCYVKGYEVPFYSSVSIDEYIGRKANGEINSQWASKPATMIRKVAQAQVLKEAFPEQNAGMYVQEEVEGASGVVLEEAAIVDPEEIRMPESVQAEEVLQDTEDAVAYALFEGGEDGE